MAGGTGAYGSGVPRQGALEVNAGLVRAGAGLMVVGVLLGSTGGLLVAAALAQAARRWARAQEVPPSRVAAQRLAALRAAGAAGAREWRARSEAPPPVLPTQSRVG